MERSDVVGTAALVLVQLIVSAVVVVAATLSLLQVGRCGVGAECNFGVATIAAFIVPVAVALALGTVIVISARRLRDRRRAWILPLFGILGTVVLSVLQLVITAVALRVWAA